MKMKEKIGHYAVSVFLVLSVVLCITVIAQTISVGYVSIFGRSLFRVVTGSMEPTIPVGSLLISKEVEIEDVKVGDIVCFRSQESYMLGQVITHRVVSVIENDEGKIYLETRGDANPSADGFYVSEKNLIGKVTAYTKEGNIFARIMSVVTSRVGFLSCIVFPVLLVSSLIMRDAVKSIRKELYTISREETEVPVDDAISPEEYEEMVERLKKEILEEVKQSVEQSGN